jgi:hypothetical protein
LFVGPSKRGYNSKKRIDAISITAQNGMFSIIDVGFCYSIVAGVLERLSALISLFSFLFFFGGKILIYRFAT